MALITCWECKKEISETAQSCPHCGAESTASKSESNKKDNSIGAGDIFGTLVVLGVILWWFGPYDWLSEESPSSTEVPFNSNDQSAVQDQSFLTASSFSGEWFSAPTAALTETDLDGRYLVIKGNVTNTSSTEVASNVRCTARIYVRFQKDNVSNFDSFDICGGGGFSEAAKVLGRSVPDLPATLGPGETLEIDTGFGGPLASVLVGPTFPGKFKPYPIESVRLKIDYTGEDPFGNQFSGLLIDSPIPTPDATAPFNLE